jgi:hypothetical protein
MTTFADHVNEFNEHMYFDGQLPAGVRMMNPFKEDKNVLPLSAAFYKKYYDDTRDRHIILGINPGRFGGGITGVPFTDSKRLLEKCGIRYAGKVSHEPSSVFIYEMIDAYGGPARFYSDFYINSICPLGFVSVAENGKQINYNYYDSPQLLQAVKSFILESIQKQLSFGINRDLCFCFGTGKNEKFLRQLNEENRFFKKIIALEHPRFIIQYKSKSMVLYIEKYLQAFRQITAPGD